MLESRERQEVTRAVEADKVRLLFQQAGSGSAGNILVALVMLWVVAPASRVFSLAALPFVGIIVVYLHRILLVRRFRQRSPTTNEMASWRRTYLISSLLAGSCWALGGLLALPQVDLQQQLFMVFIAGGLGAAAISTLAAVYTVFVVFMVPMLLGTMAGFLYAGAFQPLILGGLIALFGAVLLRTGRNQHAAIERALRLSREKDDLVRNLTKARANAVTAQMRAEAANSAKSTFLAKMSHELRTPLHGVLGMLDLLRSAEGLQRERDFARTAHSAGRSLLKLLDDLLDLSKIEAEKLELTTAPFALRRMLEEVCALFALQTKKKKLMLKQEIAAALPEHVFGDSTRLRQVLINLLANAVKFTESGAVTLVAKPAADEAQPARIFFSVRDTGIGVADEVKEGLFGAFQQADESISRRYGGTGLGLSISHQLVTLMGGSLELKSEEGRGSELSFAVDLPATEPPVERVVEDETTVVSTKPRRRASILIVDDNAINLKVAKAMVGRLGHEVFLAETGPEALRLVTEKSFHLVLMDCEMPQMSGLEAARQINALGPTVEGGGALPIVALTAHGLEAYANECREAGMCDVLTKPVSLAELERCLARWLPG